MPSKKRISYILVGVLVSSPNLALADGQHFYTASLEEADNLTGRARWRSEGSIGYLYDGVSCSLCWVEHPQRPGFPPVRTCMAGYVKIPYWQTENLRTGVRRVARDGCVPSGSSPLYRLSGPGNDHFYTINLAEKQAAVASGYADEGIAGWVYRPQNYSASLWMLNPSQTICPTGHVPLHRLYLPGQADHYYTADSGDARRATSQGYRHEGIEACISPYSDKPGLASFKQFYYRQPSPSGGGDWWKTMIPAAIGIASAIGYFLGAAGRGRSANSCYHKRSTNEIVCPP